jgi:predicted Ser/Thr protein kinase
MKKLFKLLFVLLLVGAVAAVVAAIVSRRKFESMTDDEIRGFLSEKLEGRVGEEQLASIQDAVVAGVRGRSAQPDHYVEDVEEAVEELEDVAEDAAREASEEAIEEAIDEG